MAGPDDGKRGDGPRGDGGGESANWVIGLDGTTRQEPAESAPGAAPPGEPKRRDWLVLVAIAVGIVVGVGGWWGLVGGPSEPEPEQYTVERGDTLWKIAQLHGVSVSDLKAWNQLSGDAIEVGQVLSIYPTPGHGGGSTRRAGSAGSGSARTIGGAPAAVGAGLRMPPAKPCLTLDEAALDVEGDEPDMLSSAGLSAEQLRGATRPFLSELQRCFHPGVPFSGTAVLQVTVGCDGRVAGVVVQDGGGVPSDELACIVETVGYAPFPAHDMPDGYGFTWPISLEWGG